MSDMAAVSASVVAFPDHVIEQSDKPTDSAGAALGRRGGSVMAIFIRWCRRPVRTLSGSRFP